MQIILAKNIGFCIGVKRAVELIEDAINRYGRIYSLGQFIHNESEIERLKRKGLVVVESVSCVPEGQVLALPAHGVTPDVRQQIKKRRLEVVDLICEYVKSLHHTVEELLDDGFKVLMLGDKNHPEVVSIREKFEKVLVIDKDDFFNNNLEFLEGIGVKYAIVSQTTQDIRLYKDLICSLIDRYFPRKEVRVCNTICYDVVQRQSEVLSLTEKTDVVFVLGGRRSANTRRLYELAKQRAQVYFLSGADELRVDMIGRKKRVGIISGTSTPMWVINDFVNRLKEFC